MNQFVKNNEDIEECDSVYAYYVRPFIPFWSLQSLRFEDVNSYNEVPSQKNTKYPRYLLEKLVKTWLKKDNTWFDHKEVFDILEDDIADMIDSKFPSKKDLRKYLPFIKFEKNYSHKYITFILTFSVLLSNGKNRTKCVCALCNMHAVRFIGILRFFCIPLQSDKPKHCLMFEIHCPSVWNSFELFRYIILASLALNAHFI